MTKGPIDQAGREPESQTRSITLDDQRESSAPGDVHRTTGQPAVVVLPPTDVDLWPDPGGVRTRLPIEAVVLAALRVPDQARGSDHGDPAPLPGEFLERFASMQQRLRVLEAERVVRIEEDRARAGVDRIEERLGVLAKAGWVLGASLDCRRTLQDLSEVGLGVLGVLCMVGLVEDSGCLRFVATAHVDPAKRTLLKELRDVPLALRCQTATAIRTGTSRVLGAVDDEMLRAAFGCDAHLAVVRQLDLGSTMIVPLLVRDRTWGVLVFSAPATSDPYTPGDLAMAEELARRAAVAVDNALLFSQTSDVAHALQKSLLPRLPEIPGIEIAARYHPAGEHLNVGGDFYDAFSIGANRWGLLIGDVAGKGAKAAATTAVVRHTARAAARHGAAFGVPAAVNEALLEAEDDEQFSTMIYGELGFGDGRISVEMLNCGHPAPLVLRGDGRIEEANGGGPLLGQLPVVSVDPVNITLFPGDVLVLVTDGVLEARAPRPEGRAGAPCFFDNEGLAGVLSQTRGQPAEAIAKAIEERTVAFAGGRPADDLAVLVVRVVDA